ncbi:GntR family transcriptional regulator [Candidatus Chloroploca sp. M-50]|uniref:GntR family transcriptional regulator n=1 Tax=Candidatus Chloroploca mongolica TaxID=2528176 RepID=A0ABS4D8B9_9CHLR|nr:substrate-binding domain-containing protein [Candidatus Chloroploca mongolica]MBP1465671.1 GntR family transcriptional regulator [Candidatus Chloroploca mongolica]
MEWLHLDRHADEPMYRQIVAQVKAACARGQLRPGDRLPTIRVLAERLGLHRNTVLLAYQELSTQGVIESRPGRGASIAEPVRSPEAAVRLQATVETLVRDGLAAGISIEVLTALVREEGERWRPAPLATRQAVTGHERHIRFEGSHDFSLDLLGRELHKLDPGLDLKWQAVGSMAGLRALVNGEADLAGMHLLDPITGIYNQAAIAALAPAGTIQLITLAEREQGLIVRHGNPFGLRSIADLAQPGLRFVARQPGSGTAALYHHLLTQAGLAPGLLEPPVRTVTTHLAAAAAVASHRADVALGLHTAAKAMDLAFIPLTIERYDLAVRTSDMDTPWFASLLETLVTPALHSAIQALPGYDAMHTAWMPHMP